MTLHPTSQLREPDSRPYTPTPGVPAAILVDLDGTLCLRTERKPYDETRVIEDQPNKPVVKAVLAMAVTGHRVIFMSSRREACRPDTERWLATHFPLHYEALYMRPANREGVKDSIVKAELFDNHIRHRYDVVAVFDDRDQVVQMWRAMGLTVFQVADGAF